MDSEGPAKVASKSSSVLLRSPSHAIDTHRLALSKDEQSPLGNGRLPPRSLRQRREFSAARPRHMAAIVGYRDASTSCHR